MDSGNSISCDKHFLNGICRFGLQLLCLAVLCLGFINSLSGQSFTYGNEWYNPNQQYLRIRTWQDGIYRLSLSDLLAANWDTTGIDPANYQLFYRGQEQFVHVEMNGSLLSYIEFFGFRNNGGVDSGMYRNPLANGVTVDPSIMPHPARSLFSDTAAFFLTAGPQPGKRMTDFFSVQYQNPENWYRYETYIDTTNGTFFDGGGSSYSQLLMENSDYTIGEGMQGLDYTTGGPVSVIVPTPGKANTMNPSHFSTRVYQYGDGPHETRFYINGILSGTSISNNEAFIADLTGDIVLPAAAYVTFKYEAKPIGNDHSQMGFCSFEYDRLFSLDMGSTTRIKNWNKASDAYFRFTQTAISQEGYVWDFSTHTRCRGTASGDTLKVVVPGNGASREMFVFTDQAIQSPLVDPVHSLHNISDINAGAQVILITNEALKSSALEYKQYRDTCSANPLSVKVVTVEELYDEFGWGSPTPVAIKRYCKWALDHWVQKPQFLFLWGKPNPQNYFRGNNPYAVPTWGYPASDYEFVSNFDAQSLGPVPAIPVGRLSIWMNDDGLNYVDKLRKYESSPWEPWMQEGLFLGGGHNTTQQSQIYGSLQDFMNIYKGSPWAGTAWYFQKWLPQEQTNFQIPLKEYMKRGVGLIQMYGHSSENLLEIDFEEPSFYENWNKFPFIVAFGCYGGNITSNVGTALSEKHMVAKDRGSIAYLANSTVGYIDPINYFGRKLYPQFYGTDSWQPLGVHIRNAIQVANNDNISFEYRNGIRQMLLQGDPSIHLYNPRKPDIFADGATGMYLGPGPFSATDTQFTANLILQSAGLAVEDSFTVTISQSSPGGNIIHPDLRVPAFVHNDTVSFVITNTIGQSVAGLNNFQVVLDAGSEVDEFNENNNAYTFEIFIPGKVPTLLFPPAFAVVDSDHVAFRAASYLSETSSGLTYLFEVDTVPEFNSNFLKTSGAVQGTSFLVNWAFPTALEEGQVYYWRCRLQDILPAQWASGSFRYEQGKNGWSQAEMPQFFTDRMSDIQIDSLTRIWRYIDRTIPLQVKAIPNYSSSFPIYKLAYGYYGSPLVNGFWLPGVFFTGINQNTLKPYTIGGPGNSQLGDWTACNMPANAQALINAINSVNPGDYFLMVNNSNANVPAWPPVIFTLLNQLGGTGAMNTLPSGNPFIFLGRKGYPGWAKEVFIANDTFNGQPVLSLDHVFHTSNATGRVTSPKIGPAYSWSSLDWKWSSLDIGNIESATLSLHAISLDGSLDSVVFADISQGTYSLNSLDAERFPYVRLEAELTDTVNRTAPQLSHWTVYYESAPDAVVDPISNFAFHADTLDEGQPGTLSLNLLNSTDYAFQDSLQVGWWFEKENGSRTDTFFKKMLAPAPAGSSLLNLAFTTDSLGGKTRMVMKVNPAQTQPELYFHNNLFERNFYVKTDIINPILDVTFDGKHILNNDIIRPDPEIHIQLADENQWIPVTDTSFAVYFGKSILSAILPRVFIDGNMKMEKVPVSGGQKAKLIFRPGMLENGEYTLRVQGFDGKGNASGKTEYEITFQVVNESTVSEVLNYPNPFSSCTHFVFTLTGGKMPDMFRIHIYTITGKHVKTVDLLELGQVQNGYNVTDYCWDGKDEYGDDLANGVYLYHAEVKFGKRKADLRDEGVSDFFDQGYGKMYLFR